ncbi:hypothetical protein BSKO_01134 [Bryopsis sp. KO-2023]|nr:hypothetical protein BSKO_01134 [Bryopsis sp. KO-2023]
MSSEFLLRIGTSPTFPHPVTVTRQRLLSKPRFRSFGCRKSGMSRDLRLAAENGMDTPKGLALSSPNIRAADFPFATKDCLLFYSPQTEALAKKISHVGAAKVELGEIRWGTFPDGFPNLFVQDALRVRNRHVAFLASFDDPSVIFEQISVIYALPRLFVGSFTLVLPFFPTGTQERMEAEGVVATAFTLARILSNIPPSRGGPTSLVVFDIHALQERFYFGDSVLPLFESGIPLLEQELKSLPDHDNITIAYPDEGSWKRFHSLISGYPEVVCTKYREGNKRIVRVKEGDPKDRHVVIVDDLVQSGNTLRECHSVLAAMGAKHVSAYVTHAVFPNESWRNFKHQNGGDASTGMSYFWITDSCAKSITAIGDTKPFKVLSLAGPIAQALQI